MRSELKIGIIGGSGMEDPGFISDSNSKDVSTPYGDPSSQLILGSIADVPVVILSRHGPGHSINPTNVNYRANISALKEEGCTHILAATACGSLRERIAPGHFVFPDQFRSL
jgi:5'-methylthioadenosine phosphorylase